jgi:glycosyltransferase involved in cell wall biosynthesis
VKSLLFVTNSLTGGGAERSSNLLANELFARGYTVAVVPINSSPDDLITLDCPVFPIERIWQTGILKTLISVFRFRIIVSRFKPDFVILNCDLPEFFGLFIRRGPQFVIVEHSNNPWMNRKKMGRIVRKLYEYKKVYWISVRNDLKIWPKLLTPNSSIHNPVLRPKPLIPSSKAHDMQVNRLVFLGRLSVEKGVRDFLEIASEIRFPALVIGDGPLRKELEGEFPELAGAFVGQKTNPWNDLFSNDLLVVPSLYEGDGLVVVEALAAGIPLLLADIPEFRRFGLPDIHYCKDKNAYIATICSYSNNVDQLKVSEANATPVLASRSLKVIGDYWVDFLNNSKG